MEDPREWLAANGVDLSPLTEQDARALVAIAAAWELYSYCSTPELALCAVRALLLAMQPKCRSLTKLLIARAMDWKDVDRLWPKAIAGICIGAERECSVNACHCGSDPYRLAMMRVLGTSSGGPFSGPPPRSAAPEIDAARRFRLAADRLALLSATTEPEDARFRRECSELGIKLAEDENSHTCARAPCASFRAHPWVPGYCICGNMAHEHSPAADWRRDIDARRAIAPLRAIEEASS